MLYTLTRHTVRPEFTDTLGIKKGRHPILEKLGYETPVPNDAVSQSFVHVLQMSLLFSFKNICTHLDVLIL